MWHKCIAVGIALLLAGAPVIAQSEQDDARYITSAGVARISLIKGDVTHQRGDSQDWEAADINLPLAEGDRIAVGDDSRAEIQLYGDNYIRLASHSELKTTRLTSADARFSLTYGTATVRVNRVDDDVRLRVDTPSCNIRFDKRGVYRINVSDGGDTDFQTRKGLAEVSWSSGVLDIKSGRGISIRAQDSGNYEISKDIGTDDWDRWNEDRDNYLNERQTASRYVSPSIWGARDLDYYGSWNYVSNYGYCWFPTVSYGWAPYRLGRWAWLYPWGWTWVSYEPWGWAPYHFGGWSFFAGFGWGWFPGSFFHRHFFHPAHVTFVRFHSRGRHFWGWIPRSREGFSRGDSGLAGGRDRFAPMGLQTAGDIAKLPKEIQEAISIVPEAEFTKGGKPLEFSNQLAKSFDLSEARLVQPKELTAELVGRKATPRVFTNEGATKGASIEQQRSAKEQRGAPLESNKLGEIQRERRPEKNYEAPDTVRGPERKAPSPDSSTDRQYRSERDLFRSEPRQKSYERPDGATSAPKNREREFQRQDPSPPVREMRPEPKSTPRSSESVPRPSKTSQFDRSNSPRGESAYTLRGDRGYAPRYQRAPSYSSSSPRYDRSPSYSSPSPRYSSPPARMGGQDYRSAPRGKGRG